jgi:hypothetical protein
MNLKKTAMASIVRFRKTSTKLEDIHSAAKNTLMIFVLLLEMKNTTTGLKKYKILTSTRILNTSSR